MPSRSLKGLNGDQDIHPGTEHHPFVAPATPFGSPENTIDLGPNQNAPVFIFLTLDHLHGSEDKRRLE